MARILVIDDDMEFGELTVRRLQSAGHEAIFHHGPFGTLNAIRKGSYELVLLDVSMPALDGTQIVHLIRETRGVWQTKILLYSSMDPEPLRTLAGGLDVNAFLSKSAGKAELIDKINDMLCAPN